MAEATNDIITDIPVGIVDGISANGRFWSRALWENVIRKGYTELSPGACQPP